MYRKLFILTSFLLALALVPTNFAQADLIGYWRFDESSGTIAADSAGGDNDGILFGDQLEWTAGRFGGALSHGGLRDAGVEVPTTGMSATSGTVAMWALLADPQPAHTKYLFGHTTQPEWANRVQLYMDEGDNLLDIGLGNSHTRDTDIMELPIEEWLHVALTWDSGNYVVYVNGETVATGTYIGLSDVNEVANIGNDGSSGPYEGFGGLLDDVRLYDHAMNAVEILAAMEGEEFGDEPAAEGPKIIWVSDFFDDNGDGVPDDQAWVDLLEARGYTVDYTSHMGASGVSLGYGYWSTLDDDKIAALNAADLIIVSRNSNSGDYANGDEPTQWNSVTTPIMLQAMHIVRSNRWQWLDTTTLRNRPGFVADILDAEHPIFDGVVPPVQVLDGSVALTTFPDITGVGVGNGTLIAKVPVPEADVAWIVEWEAGVEFYDGSGQIAGGQRLIFPAGTQESGGVIGRGEYNLTPEGEMIFLNTVNYMLGISESEPFDVTAPGDFVQGVPNDGDWPTAYYRPETPEMAIDDDIETKYLHFKGDFDPDPGTGGAGLQVTPSVGPTIVTGLTFTTANDFPGRDPIAFELSGSNVSIDGPYELIVSDYIVDFAQEVEWPRSTKNEMPIRFDNEMAYSHYQLIFTAIRGPVGGSVNSMQIAEVELLGVPAPGGANIIMVTEEIDWDLDGLRDDHSLETFLVSEGYSVDIRPDYWKVLTPDKIAELNAANLIIVSRLAWSSHYDEGNETTDWNSLTTPLLQMNANFARNDRWKWVNSGAVTSEIPAIFAEAVDPIHPIFIDMLLSPYALDGRLDVVQMIDPLIGTGLTTLIGGTDMGNGRLIAKSLELDTGWIAEWDVGVEFFDGAGQYAGGRRMLFCAGTQEIQYYDYDRQEVITTAQGELNLTDEGLQMFRNAIAYLLVP